LDKIKLCRCGCGQEIIFKDYHKKYGTPNYISGHNRNSRTTPGFHLSNEHKLKLRLAKLGKHQPLMQTVILIETIGKNILQGG